MSEHDIQELMEVGNVTREYAIELLELTETCEFIFPVIPANEYESYLSGPTDPRD
jgi:hypothetical protein